MSISRKVSTTAAISVAGAGIVVGGIGLAAADDRGSGQDSATQTNARTAEGSAAGFTGSGEGRGHGRGHRGGPGEQSAGLAEALGLPESDVTAAMRAVRDQLRPEAPAEGESRTPPTEAEREARRAEMAAALADELGVSVQKVTDALDSVAADRKAEVRSGLATRLDTAVADGSLTEADKQSVLKAFDAGVLGRGQHGPDGAGEADEGAATS